MQCLLLDGFLDERRKRPDSRSPVFFADEPQLLGSNQLNHFFQSGSSGDPPERKQSDRLNEDELEGVAARLVFHLSHFYIHVSSASEKAQMKKASLSVIDRVFELSLPVLGRILLLAIPSR